MPFCELLLPPIQLSDRLVTVVGEQILLGDNDAETLAKAGVVRIINEPGLKPIIEPADPTPVETPPTDEADKISEEEATPQPRTGLDLNRASEAELVALPGVGRAIAQRIIKHRPYASLEALQVDADLTDNQFNALTSSEVYV